MGFGVATKGAADISEMFFSLEKYLKSVSQVQIVVLSKGRLREPESWQNNSQALLPWQGWVCWVAGGAHSLETWRIWRM